MSGAQAFVRSIGPAGDIFRRSSSSNRDEHERADALIASVSPAVVRTPGGGILHYRCAYPNDALLRIWSGLVLFNQGRPALAAAEFTAAVKCRAAMTGPRVTSRDPLQHATNHEPANFGLSAFSVPVAAARLRRIDACSRRNIS